MIERKLEELDRRYEDIRRLRRELSAYRTACKQAITGHKSCPMIEDFIHTPASRGRRRGKSRGER